MESKTTPNRARVLLIIDSDAENARLFQLLLNDLGLRHRCQHAPSGGAALDLLRGNKPYENAPRPELIILDGNLPGMAGCEVLREIKSDPSLCCIPVIMFSLARDGDEINACYCERANAFIRKPGDYEGTLRVVREIDRFWFHTATLPAPFAASSAGAANR